MSSSSAPTSSSSAHSGRHIAIIGSGPTGLEAALAAIEHGYAFTLYEAAPVVSGNVDQWGHVSLFSPWSLNVSPRARRHLATLGENPPDGDDCPTGRELIEHVFGPLSRLPEVSSSLRLSTRVLEVGREGLVKNDEIGTGKRAEHCFRLLVENAEGNESVERADIVLDCSGTYGHPNRLGDGGIAAPGERAAGERIVRQIPDVDAEPQAWINKRLLVVGGGHSAQTTVAALTRLAKQHPGTQVFWALRNDGKRWQADPDDPLPMRAELVRRAIQIVSDEEPACQVFRSVVVEAVANEGSSLSVTLRSTAGETVELAVDRVLALTGAVGDHSVYRQLQVHECYATSGPMSLAAALLGEASSDCLAQTSHGPETLKNPEPNFFLLGSKSYGRNTSFLMRVGWQQVEEVFSLLSAAS